MLSSSMLDTNGVHQTVPHISNSTLRRNILWLYYYCT